MAELSGAEGWNAYQKRQQTMQLEQLYSKARKLALDLEQEII